MNASVAAVSSTLAIGIGATVLMDLWLLFLSALGLAKLNFTMIGRWVGHIRHGRFTHRAIGEAAAIEGEQMLGWVAHYAVGIIFAALLVAVSGAEWLSRPTLGPALVVGLLTLAAPLLVMQPAMGAGVAFSNTASPLANCLRSLANHAVFGSGLFLSALALGSFWP
jgi:hypothetical protein